MRFPGTRTLSFAYFVAAILTGFLLSMGFPGTNFPTISLGFVIPLAFLPLFLAMELLPTGRVSQGRTARHDYTVTAFGRGRDAFFLCWIAGASLNSIAFFWTTKPAILFGNLPPDLAYAVFALYCLLSGLFLPVVLSPFILNVARGAKKFQRPP